MQNHFFEIPNRVGEVRVYLDESTGCWIVSIPREISPGMFEFTHTPYRDYFAAIAAACAIGRGTTVLH